MSLKRIRFFLEVGFARIALLLIPPLSRRAVISLARKLGWMAYHVSGSLRRVGMANLTLAFGSKMAPREKQRILREAFNSFALAMLDMLWFSKDTRERIKMYVKLDPSYSILLQPGPHIFISAHLGNWEILGMAITQQYQPLTSVAAPLENARLNELFNNLRRLTGQEVQSKYGAVRSLLRALKDGKAVALLLDQNTKPSEGGIFVDFFDRPVPVSSAGALLALRTRAKMVVAVCYPRRDGTYVAPPLIPVINPVSSDAKDEDVVRRITQDISQGIEQLVRQYPEHWLWMYKRWKYIGPGHRADEYPDYARPLPEERRADSRRKLSQS